MTIKILFLAASPIDQVRVRVDQECRMINKALRSAEFREQFTLENHDAVRIEDLQELLLLHHPQIVHFSGHGNLSSEITLENNSGTSQPVPVKALSRLFAILKDNIRCVVLNACYSEDQARAIAEHIDVVIGMSQGISDEAALAFSVAFYQTLAYGKDLQTAFDLGCNTLHLLDLNEQDTPRLIAPRVDPAQIILADIPDAEGISSSSPRPPFDLFDLPTFSETFQGRQTELAMLESHLTGPARPHILTLYGAPGQGKTTLARQAVERFAPTWPAGIFAVSLENLPARSDLVVRLAEFLKLDLVQLSAEQAERRILQSLEHHPILLILDNAETLLDALDDHNPASADLAFLIFERIPATTMLFFTSRRRLGRPKEQHVELSGLTPAEGASLFQECAPDVPSDLDLIQLEALSRMLDGHPLSLRLLALAFNQIGGRLTQFIHQFEQHLTAAENNQTSLAHRQRTLFACIETSVQTLGPELKTLFGNLALFHSPFMAGAAAAIYDPDAQESPIPSQLWQLRQRGLLEREVRTVGVAPLETYRLLPPLRLYAEQGMVLGPQTSQRFAQVYGALVRWIDNEIDKDPSASFLARLAAVDMERALEHTQDIERGWYNLRLGHMECRMGYPRKGKSRLEQALECGRDRDHNLMLHALNELGEVYNSLGQPQEALKYYREVLLSSKEVGDRAMEAVTLHNIGVVYQRIGHPQEALKHFRETLPIMKEVGDHVGEAVALNNIGLVYARIGQIQEALKYYQDALLIHKKFGIRAQEATTLDNIGTAYQAIGQPQEALKYYQEALPIHKDMGNRVMEATTLDNIGTAYRGIGQPQEAPKYYQEALSIHKDVGNRTGEATTLSNMAMLLAYEGENLMALDFFRQILIIRQEIGAVAGEAATLYTLAFLLGCQLGEIDEAIPLLLRSIELLKSNHLPQDSARQTLTDHESLLADLEAHRP